MRIESALYASSAGLNTHGQAIAVISDNISNADTTGYKAARAEFGDLFSEATGMKDGGPISGGSGSKLTSVRILQHSGDTEFTGRPLDVAVAGEGYFIVGDEASPLYTRAGNFQLDSEGYLVTSDGQYVLGTAPNAAAGSTALTRINLAQISSTATPTSNIVITGNVSSAATAVTTIPTAPATFRELGQAASAVQILESYDSLGAKHNVYLEWFKTDKNKWTAQAYIDGGDLDPANAGKPVLLGEKKDIVFQEDGTIADANKAGAIITASGDTFASGATGASFKIDFSGYTQNANASELKSKTQDGVSTGTIKTYEVGKNGMILATLSNGALVNVGQLQIAKFTNMDGLVRAGNGYFTAGTNTGTKVQGAPGSSGLGDLQGGALERSTTDLASSFVDLVIYQRGYQANSKMLDAVGTMLRETIGIIR